MKEKINYMTGRFTKEIHRATNEPSQILIDNTDLNVKKFITIKPYTNLYANVTFGK